MSDFKIGIYKHFKGGLYEVVSIAKHTETLEDLVVYKKQGDESSALWVRPLSMFLEKVVVDNKEVPRFKYVGD